MKKIIKWLENYWYYYKTHTLLGAFFLVFFIICIMQLVGKGKIDAYIMYAGPVSIGGTQVEKIESSFEQVMPGDFNNDGKKTSQVLTVYLMTDNQIAWAVDEAKRNGISDYYIDIDYMKNAQKQFDLQFLAGDCYICLLDPELYGEMKEQGAFEEIKNILGSEFPLSGDGIGVKFWNTDFAKFFAESYANIPKDTILCLRKLPATSIGKAGEGKKQAFHAELYAEILKYSQK